MNADAMAPFGRALLAYLDGDCNAQAILRRDDGKEIVVPMAPFFRDESGLSAIDNAVVERCAGRVLDVGAGAGSLSAVLQRKGHAVTAIDISPYAVTVAKRRGVAEVVDADLFEFEGGPFDTLLMLGIGMVETIAGLKRLLAGAESLLASNGQLLVDSMDVRATADPATLAYHEANRKAGRYAGEVRMQFEFQGRKGPWCGWLYVDAETLTTHAQAAGWLCEVVHQEANGAYLARLRKRVTV